MKLNARNRFKGEVISIEEDEVNAIVGIKIKGGDIITATISLASVRNFGLQVGKEAYAVIKATSVMVGLTNKRFSQAKKSSTARRGFFLL